MWYFAGRTGWPDAYKMSIKWDSEEFHARGMAELPRILFGHERGNLRYATLALIKWPKHEWRKKWEKISSQIPRSGHEVYCWRIHLISEQTFILKNWRQRSVLSSVTLGAKNRPFGICDVLVVNTSPTALSPASTMYGFSIGLRPGGASRNSTNQNMCYLIGSFRAHEQQAGEVSVLKISSLTKSVIFFPSWNSFSTLRNKLTYWWLGYFSSWSVCSRLWPFQRWRPPACRHAVWSLILLLFLKKLFTVAGIFPGFLLVKLAYPF